MKKVALIVCAIALFIAVANLPMWYYGFLRTIVAGVSVYMFFDIFNAVNKLTDRSAIFGAIAILFIVFHFEKGIWMLIDIVCAIYFIVQAFRKEE